MATHTNDHDVFREQAALYAIGALGEVERSTFEAHLSECAECAAEVRSFLPVTTAMLQSVPQHDPRADLRDRVLGTVGDADQGALVRAVRVFRPFPAWMSAAALLVLVVGLGVYAGFLRSRIGDLEADLRSAIVRIDISERDAAAARRLAGNAQIPIAVFMAPDVKQINLVGQPAAPRATARAFWSRARGLVLTASMLPALPAGRTYQLWVVTAQAPISAGLLRPDQNGEITATFDTPRDIPEPVAMAVTLEPDGGVAAPTGARYLVGLAN